MRLVSRLAPPAAIATLAATALAITAASASAEVNCANANAKASFQKHMNEARFFIGLADTLDFFGQRDLSEAATRDADRAMDAANVDLSAC
jgi:hypothetical protein